MLPADIIALKLKENWGIEFTIHRDQENVLPPSHTKEHEETPALRGVVLCGTSCGFVDEKCLPAIVAMV